MFLPTTLGEVHEGTAIAEASRFVAPNLTTIAHFKLVALQSCFEATRRAIVKSKIYDSCRMDVEKELFLKHRHRAEKVLIDKVVL